MDELVIPQPTAEEVALKEEEIRAKVVTEYGFDEVDDAERIDKLVAREIEHRAKLDEAITAKVKHRTEAEELKKKLSTPTTPPPQNADELEKKLEEKIAAKFEERDLGTFEYPKDIKEEIKKLARLQGVSVTQAARDPYIVYKIQDWEKAQKVEQATISRTNRSGSKRTYSIDNPPDVDMNTPEGRKEWAEYKAEMIKAGH